MKTFLTLIIAPVLLLMGCAQDNITGPSLETDIINVEPSVEVAAKTVKVAPYIGIASGWGTVDFRRTDCPEGTLPVYGEGKGKSTRIGRIDVTISHCSYFFVDPTNPNFVDGVATLTAVNGDKVFIEYYGYVTGPTTFYEVDTIVGGTGRYTNVGGGAEVFGTVAVTDEGFDWSIEYEGLITRTR